MFNFPTCRVSTLDRRMTMKLQRPRSLDLSSWSVGKDIRISVYLSIYLDILISIYLSIYLSWDLSICLSTNCNIYHFAYYLYWYLSIDLSIVESRSSNQTSSSSDGSDKACSPSVSRNASFLSHKSSAAIEPTSATGPSSGLNRNQSVCRKPAKPKSEISHRTVTTLMGGRGYINWKNIRHSAANLPGLLDS